ncbi:MAG TPA: class I SAM-dependent methyltransferase [Actinomycetes bacterium]|nr:class I SAM-dependent methyltransferase [Actinomycetes bacterium]
MSRLESDYYAYMDFDPHGEHARKVQWFYVEMFTDLAPVLDLGCGRGEFLSLLDDAGIKGQGVDSDEGMVEKARARGFEVACEDAIEYLHGDPAPGPFNGVFCAHFVEHLTPDQLARLLAGVRRVLAPGGKFIAATPNPACYAVLTHDFWRDPTHVRFYDGPLLEFFCRQAGFEVEEVGPNPHNHPGPPPPFLAPQPAVHPGLDEALDDAARKVAMAMQHQGRGRWTEAHDATWVHQLVHVTKVLSDRLQETQEALRALHRAHENLVWGMYEANEIFVRARA